VFEQADEEKKQICMKRLKLLLQSQLWRMKLIRLTEQKQTRPYIQETVMTTQGVCHHRPRTDDGSNFPRRHRSPPRSIRLDEDEHVDPVFFHKLFQMLRPSKLQRFVSQVTDIVVVVVAAVVVVCEMVDLEEVDDVVVVVVVVVVNGMVVEKVVGKLADEMEMEMFEEKLMEAVVGVVGNVVVVVVDDVQVGFPMIEYVGVEVGFVLP